VPENGLSDPRRKRFSPYVRCLADKMGLRDWTTCICDNAPSDSECVAENECIYGQKWINIYLGESFFRKSEPYQRQTICHELIHAHIAPMSQFLRSVLDRSEAEAYRVTMEYAVDGMATEWADHLPLPSQVKPPRSQPNMGRQKAVKATKAPEPRPKPKAATPKGTAAPKPGKAPGGAK
jgi:hypothetical protein